MRRALLFLVSIVITVIATIGWPERFAFDALVIVAICSWTIGAVAWPSKRRAPWFRGEREAG